MNRLLPRKILQSAFALVLLCAASTGLAAEPAHPSGERHVTIEVKAAITMIDPATRQVSLQSSDGDTVTVVVPESAADLSKLHVGDVLRAVYIAAVAGEVREPTEEELANPWVVQTRAGAGAIDNTTSAVGGARAIRAVCTIEGMNRLLGTVTVMDSNGLVHVIGDVSPEKMAGVTLGQTIVIDYDEALAISLEKVGSE